jgi:hypothetical protein
MKIENSFLFLLCASCATMTRVKKNAAMDMAKRTAAAAVQAKKKKVRNPPPSDEDEDELTSQPPSKSKRRRTAEASSPSEENSSSSDADEASHSIESSHEQNELSRKEDTVEGEPKTKTTTRMAKHFFIFSMILHHEK